MKKNMGTIDRVVRIALAIAIIGLYIADILPTTWAIILLIVSGIFIATSFMSFCPLYLPFGLSTLRKK